MKNTLARPLFLSLLFAIPSVGCISEFHDSSDSCDTDPAIVEDPVEDPTVTNCPDPSTTIYLGTSREICDGIEFTCPDEYSAFNAACGCGCEALPPDDNNPPLCPTEEGEGITVLSRDLKVCGSIEFSCNDGQTAFNGTCGCGCIDDSVNPPPPACPDRADPKVHYLGDEGSAQCTVVSFTCPAECVQFNDTCGCGCIEP